MFPDDSILPKMQDAISKYRGFSNNVPLAICVSPIVADKLKEMAKDLTGQDCAKKLCGLPVFEFDELPNDRIIITTQEFALNILKNRIPHSEA